MTPDVAAAALGGWAGQVLLVIDSMKMLHEVTAPRAGKVTGLRVETGGQVDAGALLAVIEEPADQ